MPFGKSLSGHSAPALDTNSLSPCSTCTRLPAATPLDSIDTDAPAMSFGYS